MTTKPPAVVVFGSLHYDIIVKGPARPRKGETVTGTAWHPACGGKGGNQAVAAAKRGVACAMIGAVADDEFGRILVANLKDHNVMVEHVRTVEDAGSGMSVAVFDSEGDYGAVIVSGSNLQLGAQDLGEAGALFQPGNILVLQNEVPDAANVVAAAAMKQAGGKVILNAAPARELSGELSELVDILVVNAVEAEALAGCGEVNDLNEALAAARQLAGRYPTVIVTAGGEGVAFAGSAQGTVPALKVKLVSTHGAGDEFIGVLAAALVEGADLQAAIVEANHAAAALVSSPR